MTEDMRERFEKAREDFAAAYNDMHSRCVARAAFMAGWQEAALSSAGTSGTADYWILEWSFKGKNKWQPVDRPPFRSEMEVLSYRQREGFDYRIVALRGDSLSGKGEATKIPTGSTEPTSDVSGAGKVQDAAPSPTAAPDRAEELARPAEDEFEKAWRDYNANGNAGGWERVAFVCGFGKGFAAALLREAEGRWIPVSERLPCNNDDWVIVWKRGSDSEPTMAYYDSVVMEWVTLAPDWNAISPTHWQPLPAPPREGGNVHPTK